MRILLSCTLLLLVVAGCTQTPGPNAEACTPVCAPAEVAVVASARPVVAPTPATFAAIDQELAEDERAQRELRRQLRIERLGLAELHEVLLADRAQIRQQRADLRAGYRAALVRIRAASTLPSSWSRETPPPAHRACPRWDQRAVPLPLE